jgi:hypothetical protein
MSMRWHLKHPLDGTELSRNAGVRPAALKPDRIVRFARYRDKARRGQLQEIADELHHRCGVNVRASHRPSRFASERHRTAQPDSTGVRDGL